MKLPLGLIVVFGALVALGLKIYGALGLRLSREGGKVQDRGFALPDLLISFVLASTFGLLAVASFISGPEERPELRVGHVLPSSLILLGIISALALFLRYRGVHLRTALGLSMLPAGRALSQGAGFMLAALPLLWVTNLIVLSLIPENAGEQEMVKLFRDVTGRGDWGGVAIIGTAAVLLAPIVEEFLFRGYFYPTFKQHFGGISSAMASSALFAAFHLNLASLPGLFVLALCLTLAYEASGSLLVPIVMHALFNALNLLLLYLQVSGAVPTQP